MIFVFQMLYELIAIDFSNLFIFPLQLDELGSRYATDIEPVQPVFCYAI